MENDYIYYIDTDSLFIGLGEFLDNNIGTSWRKLDDGIIIKFMLKIAGIIQNHVNNLIYRNIQRRNYNSDVTDFRINLKQEIISKTALFIKKKKYAYWIVNSEGTPIDEISATGLEIIRSDTPEIVRPLLKEIMTMVLKRYSDDEITNFIEKSKKVLYNSKPEEIAVNIGVSNIAKYKDAIKGTPWHIKGVYNYRKLLKILKIDNIYENIHDGTKAKVLYVKNNSMGMDTITFLKWPDEFDKIVQIDYNTMIDKYFIRKVSILLEPMGKTNLLNKKLEDGLNYFF